MNIVTVLHNKAMEFADEALLAKMEGNKEASISLFEKAFSLEKEAATSIKEKDQKSDSWYILVRSAASLAINCGRYQDADAFNPENFGFFLRKEKLYPSEVRFFEKDHESIDKSIEKDWKRLNLFLTIDGSFVTIWYGVIDPLLAESEYSKEFKLPWKDYDPDEQLFRGYITNKQEAEIILNAIRYLKFKPQYLGRP